MLVEVSGALDIETGPVLQDCLTELLAGYPETLIIDLGGAVGTHTQQASFKGNPVDGSFRATHIAVRAGDRWLLVGIHMSPVGGPPPFAQQQPGAGPAS